MTVKTAERHWNDLWKDEDDSEWEALVPARFRKLSKKEAGLEAFWTEEGGKWEW